MFSFPFQHGINSNDIGEKKNKHYDEQFLFFNSDYDYITAIYA